MGDNALPRSRRLPSKRPNDGCAVRHFPRLSAGGMQETPKTIQATPIARSHPPHVDGTALVLKAAWRNEVGTKH